MTNEEIIKLDGYRSQITQFSLRMEDEMKTAQNDKWLDFSRKLIALRGDMSKDIENQIEARG